MSRRDETATATAYIKVDLAIDYIRFDSEARNPESETEEELDVPAIARVDAESDGQIGGSWSAWITEIELG